MAFITPDLSYGYDALEPYIDEATMKIHHDKHHAAYTSNVITSYSIHYTKLYD